MDASPRGPRQLAGALAERARRLRRLAADELARSDSDLAALRRSPALAALADDGLADAYAQLIAFGLWAARWLDPDARFARDRVAPPTAPPPLADLLARVLGARVAPPLARAVDELVDWLAHLPVRDIFAGEPAQDPAIHFYERFLDVYDPRQRRRRGVYYTPGELVDGLVDAAHAALQRRLDLPLGLADPTPWRDLAAARGLAVPAGVDPAAPFVQLLDPAAGTGAFLSRALERIHATMHAAWSARGWDDARRRDAWQTYVAADLLPRLHGLEVMPVACLVCHLRLALLLARTGYRFTGDERLQVHLADTLRDDADAPAAKWDAPVSVILGNPPYARDPHGAGHRGGWMLDGSPRWRGGRPPMRDFFDGAREAGAGANIQAAHNAYVYFWRWSCWRAFERHDAPGVVALVTAASFLRGPGFAGMRAYLRRHAREIHVLDLGGDRKADRASDNVFAITVPVCATLVVRDGPPRGPAVVHYHRPAGDRAAKLAACARFDDLRWLPAAADDHAPLLPADGDAYARWPALADLLPLRFTGFHFYRTWPLAPDPALLADRWRALLAAPPPARAALFKETRDRRVDRACAPLGGGERPPALADLPADAPAPPVVRVGFRSFDRQWCLADARLGDFLRPALWATRGDDQIYLASMLAGVLGPGPAATASAHVPDCHYFCGRGGKDIFPLWQDPAARRPNLAPGLLAALARIHGRTWAAEDVFAYVYAVLSAPDYVHTFAESLQIPGPRIPVTRDPALFERGAALGRLRLCWHTFGERLRPAAFELRGTARALVPVGPALPGRHHHDAAAARLHVGDGVFAPVSAEVAAFAVSGLPVLRSWLDYRTRRGAGRRSSPLDELRPAAWTAALTRELLELLWTLEWTVAQTPALAAWLAEVLAQDPCAADELEIAPRGP